jgi:hypothetical protein
MEKITSILPLPEDTSEDSYQQRDGINQDGSADMSRTDALEILEQEILGLVAVQEELNLPSDEVRLIDGLFGA